MSASNFYNNNARAIYAVGMDDDELYFIKEDLQETAKTELDFYTSDFFANDSRNYELHILSTKDYTFTFAGESFYLSIELGLRPGYYQGCNIDYNITIDSENGCTGTMENGDVPGLVSGLLDDMESANIFAINKGLFKMQFSNLQRALEDWINQHVKDVERVCEMCAGHKLGVYASFSNGETWYKEIQ